MAKINVKEITKSVFMTASTNYNSFNQGTSIKFGIELEEGEEVTKELEDELYLRVYNSTLRSIDKLITLDNNARIIWEGREFDLREVEKYLIKVKNSQSTKTAEISVSPEYERAIVKVKPPIKPKKD
jgi:hypothetical protein